MNLKKRKQRLVSFGGNQLFAISQFGRKSDPSTLTSGALDQYLWCLTDLKLKKKKEKKQTQDTGVRQRTVQLQISLRTSGLGAAEQKKVRSWLH